MSLKAVDTSYNTSVYSGQVTAHTNYDTMPPATPMDLTATAGSGSNS